MPAAVGTTTSPAVLTFPAAPRSSSTCEVGRNAGAANDGCSTANTCRGGPPAPLAFEGTTARSLPPETKSSAGGPAAKAGFKAGDVLLEVGGQKTDDLRALLQVLQSKKPGDTVTVHFLRDGKRQAINLKLG